MDKRVLIIDDDKWVVMSTQMVLEAEGFEVRSAAGGIDGLEQARNWRPSMILLDLLMPGIDGWETLERLQSDPSTSQIPVVVFSARETNSQEIQRFKGMGQVEFFRKPFRPEELVERLELCMQKVPAAPTSSVATY